jgi:hypothetical protein
MLQILDTYFHAILGKRNVLLLHLLLSAFREFVGELVELTVEVSVSLGSPCM